MDCFSLFTSHLNKLHGIKDFLKPSIWNLYTHTYIYILDSFLLNRAYIYIGQVLDRNARHTQTQYHRTHKHTNTAKAIPKPQTKHTKKIPILNKRRFNKKFIANF